MTHWYNPFAGRHELYRYTTEQFLFWCVQTMTGWSLADFEYAIPVIINDARRSDTDEYLHSLLHPHLIQFRDLPLPTNLLKLPFRMGLLDYLFVVPFLLKLFISFWLPVVFDRNPNPPIIKKIAFFFLAAVTFAGPCIFQAGVSLLNYAIAFLVTTILSPVLLLYRQYMKYQLKSMFLMPVLSDLRFSKNHQIRELSNHVLIDILNNRHNQNVTEVPFHQRHPVHLPSVIRPILLTDVDKPSLILGLYDDSNHLCSIIIPNVKTKEGILTIKKNNLFDFANAHINENLLNELLEQPHWSPKAKQQGVLHVMAALCNQVAPSKDQGMGPIAKVDELSNLISQFADLGPISRKTLKAHIDLERKYPLKFFQMDEPVREPELEVKVCELVR